MNINTAIRLLNAPISGKIGKENRGNEKDCDELNAGDVEVVRMTANDHPNPVGEAGVELDTCCELMKSVVNKVVAHVNAATLNTRVVRRVLRSFARKIEGSLRYLGFGEIGVTGNKSNPLTVQLAALEIH